MRVRVGGVFGADLPIRGSVTVTGVDGTERTATSDATGAFIIDGDFLFPVALRGESADGRRVLHAIVAAPPANASFTLAHITPFTDLVAARFAPEGDPATTWAQRGTILRQVQTGDVAKVHDAIAAALAKARAILGASDPADFLSGESFAKTRVDAVLENVRVEVTPLAGGVTVYAMRQAGFPSNVSLWTSKDDTVPTLPFREDRKVSPSAVRDAGLAVYADLARTAGFDRTRFDAATWRAARADLVAAGLAAMMVDQFVPRFAKLLSALAIASPDAAARSFATYFDDGDGKRFERALSLADAFVASDKARDPWRTLAASLLAHDPVAGVATFEARYGDGTRFGEWNMAGTPRPVGAELPRPQRVECLAPRYAGRVPPQDVSAYILGSRIVNRCDERITLRSCTWRDDAKGGNCTDAVVERAVDAGATADLSDAIDTRAFSACGPGDALVENGNGRSDVRIRFRTLTRCAGNL